MSSCLEKKGQRCYQFATCFVIDACFGKAWRRLQSFPARAISQGLLNQTHLTHLCQTAPHRTWELVSWDQGSTIESQMQSQTPGLFDSSMRTSRWGDGDGCRWGDICQLCRCRDLFRKRMPFHRRHSVWASILPFHRDSLSDFRETMRNCYEAEIYLTQLSLSVSLTPWTGTLGPAGRKTAHGRPEGSK